MPLKNKLTLAAFIAKFSSEKACHEYPAKKRWPNGFVCPSCKGTHGWMLADGKYECSHCHKQVSVTAGTVLHRSHVPLTKWFLAFYLVMSDKRGISAVELSTSIGVTYKTAWYMQPFACPRMARRGLPTGVPANHLSPGFFLLLPTVSFSAPGKSPGSLRYNSPCLRKMGCKPPVEKINWNQTNFPGSPFPACQHTGAVRLPYPDFLCCSGFQAVKRPRRKIRLYD